MILLLIAGLLMRGLYRAQTIDPGFQMKNIAVASFDLIASGYSPQRSEAFQRQLTERVIALPGVDAVAQVGSAPLSNSHFGDLFLPDRKGAVRLNSTTFRQVISVAGHPIVRGQILPTPKSHRRTLPSLRNRPHADSGPAKIRLAKRSAKGRSVRMPPT
jgi:hypothetical protein